MAPGGRLLLPLFLPLRILLSPTRPSPPIVKHQALQKERSLGLMLRRYCLNR